MARRLPAGEDQPGLPGPTGAPSPRLKAWLCHREAEMTWVTLLGLGSPITARLFLTIAQTFGDLSSSCYSLFWNAFFPSFLF